MVPVTSHDTRVALRCATKKKAVHTHTHAHTHTHTHTHAHTHMTKQEMCVCVMVKDRRVLRAKAQRVDTNVTFANLAYVQLFAESGLKIVLLGPVWKHCPISKTERERECVCVCVLGRSTSIRATRVNVQNRYPTAACRPVHAIHAHVARHKRRRHKHVRAKGKHTRIQTSGGRVV